MKILSTGSNLPFGKTYTGGRGIIKTASEQSGNVSSFPTEWFSPLLSFVH
jgi:hypothetical protein